ncbi:methylase [Ignicoccus pacificus DSM 13166]|uniref:Methylase n=1 Tax=Ignicoccus pacificus DSM 13166 TaxID=940294 RepID=A0A977KBP3_9CREN|nr:methylase [Ignicoccus pacificus DSM 13166]
MSKLVPWIASPVKVVEEVTKLARIGPGDVVYDLGSGDGRVIVLTSKLTGARGVGVEIDPALIVISEEKAKEYGVQDKVKFLQKDFREVDLSEATVVYLYIYYNVIKEYLLEKLENELKPGTRVVTLEIPVPGWMPVVKRGVQDEAGVVRTLYLYIKGISEPSAWKNDEASDEWMEEFRRRLWGNVKKPSLKVADDTSG